VIYRFGDFTLDPASFRLLDKETLVPLSPKIIDLLLYLVARPSVLVSKEELFKALWPDVAVTDNALTQAVSELRQALGDDAPSPAYVQTVSRRGYRFIAAVHHGDGGPGRSDPAPPPTERLLYLRSPKAAERLTSILAGLAGSKIEEGGHKVLDPIKKKII
jgi:DNA-binding winged helix-turn-helix (wHTH) protein